MLLIRRRIVKLGGFIGSGQTLVRWSHQTSSVTERQKRQFSKTDSRQVGEKTGEAKRRGEVEKQRKCSQRQREREMLWGPGPGQSMLCGSEQGKTAAAAAAAGAMFSQRTTGFYLHTTRLTHVECHGFHSSIYSSTHLL